MTAIRITRAGPVCTVQDAGRFGMLRHGVSASGPMDESAYRRAAVSEASTALEFTRAGIAFVVEGALRAGVAGGEFKLRVNGKARDWPTRMSLKSGDEVEITPGKSGNYGYLRFDREIDVPAVMGSRATNLIAKLGGFEGRALRAGDLLQFGAKSGAEAPDAVIEAPTEGPIRVIWGLHADLFGPAARASFVSAPFIISTRIDRMGARLEDREGVFAGAPILSLVSDAVVPGDIQILGDGTPIVLLRDHQPTGGYPRIATLLSADIDRFAQLRPGSEVHFQPVMLGGRR